MPIYDFKCQECGRVSEIFVRSANDQVVRCPDCGSNNMERLITASYMVKMGTSAKQFGEDVLWGKLDYLIIDLPPGTADAPLTVMQSFPISGVIIVFTPQDLVEMIVRKWGKACWG